MKTAQEVAERVEGLSEYPDYADRTGNRAEVVVEKAAAVCMEQSPGSFQGEYNAELVFRVAAYMVRNNEPAARAYLYC